MPHQMQVCVPNARQNSLIMTPSQSRLVRYIGGDGGNDNRSIDVVLPFHPVVGTKSTERSTLLFVV